jgi:hypothetical protein
LFSCFACPNSFPSVPRAMVLFSCFASGLVFDGTEGVGSYFLVLHSWTRFRRYRGRPIPFSCFSLPDMFYGSTVFMFCAPGLIFDGTEDVRSCFLILRSLTHFRWYRGRPIPFSCFSLLDMFLAVPRASGPVFLFCAPGLIFGDTEGVGSLFHVMRS